MKVVKPRTGWDMWVFTWVGGALVLVQALTLVYALCYIAYSLLLK